MGGMDKYRYLTPRLFFFFLLFLITLNYSNTVFSPFILDDYSAFVKNPNLYIQDLSFDSLKKLAHTRFGMARVIPIATLALDHYISKGQSMVNYHVTNIIIHIFSTVTVAFFLSALFKTRGAAKGVAFFRPQYFVLAVTALWALSPLQTNAVTYIVQRMTSLAALFYVLSITLYIHARLAQLPWKRMLFYAGFFVTAVCAFLSKENSATLPIAVLLVEFMFIAPGRLQKIIKAVRWYHWLLLVFAAALLLPLFEHPWYWATSGFGGRHFTMPERLLTELRIIVFYISLLCLPLPGRMNLDHDFTLSTTLFSPPVTFLALLFLVGLVCAAIMCRKKYPLVSFGLFWFFLNLLLESSFVPLELIFEHRLYLPSIGFFIAVLSYIDQLLGRHAANAHPEIKKIVLLVFLIVVSVSSILTSVRNNDWQDRVTLYKDGYEKSPNKSRAASNYAMALGKAGSYNECIKYGKIANSLGVQGYEDYMNSATNTLACLMMQEKYEEAVQTGEQFKKQILQKKLAFIEGSALTEYMFNLGRVYTEEGQYREGLKSFQISLFQSPGRAEIYFAINRLLLLAQEEEDGRLAIHIGESKYEIPVYLAKLAIQYRQYKRAALYLRDAQKLGKGHEEILSLGGELQDIIAKNRKKSRESNIYNDSTYSENRLFRLYLKTSNFILEKYRPLKNEPVGWLLMQARKIDPDNPFLPVYRARWHKKNGRIDEAIVTLQDYLAENEDFVPALELLGVCYRAKNEYSAGVEYFKKILDVYPGTPNWKNYLSYIYQYEDALNKSDRTPLDYY